MAIIKTITNDKGYICEDCNKLATPTTPCDCESTEVTDEDIAMLDYLYT